MTAPWWHTAPDPVRGVLALADLPDDTAALILRAFGHGQHADAIKALAADLRQIDRCGWDDPYFVLLDEYDGKPPSGSCLALADQCDELADEKRADVITRAQLIASLIARDARARLAAVGG